MYVYLIGNRDYGFYKIGITRSEVRWRLETIDSPRLPFPLEILAEYDAGCAAHYIESELHKLFKKRQVRGEWFVAVSPKEFLRKAKLLHKAFVPKPKRKHVDPYAGTRWGRRPSSERMSIVLSLQGMSTVDAKKMMDRELERAHND